MVKAFQIVRVVTEIVRKLILALVRVVVAFTIGYVGILLIQLRIRFFVVGRSMN